MALTIAKASNGTNSLDRIYDCVILFYVVMITQ